MFSIDYSATAKFENQTGWQETAGLGILCVGADVQI